MYDICFYFFMFMFFSILGWTMECIVCSIEEHRFVHERGFCIGPYCPIYGFGIISMYTVLNIFNTNPVSVFLISFIGASLLEYLTSVIMEKMFNARWWDYSHYKFNINGRICLRNAIGFGILGLMFSYVIKPFYLSLVDKIPANILIVTSIILFTIYLIDNIASLIIMHSIKNKLVHIKKDATRDIDKEVKDILYKYTFYFKRLFKSFPNFKFSFPIGEVLVNSIHKTLNGVDELRKEQIKKIGEIKDAFKKES